MSKNIDKIRKKFKVPNEARLKFKPAPDNLPHEHFSMLKQNIIEESIAQECILFASFILHDIATGGPDTARRNEINRICYNFNCFLQRKRTHGLVLLDRFKDKKIDAHLREKFSVGVVGLPYHKSYRLENIVGLHYAAVGQSHFCSVVDIILCSLRFAVNILTDKDKSQIDNAKKY